MPKQWVQFVGSAFFLALHDYILRTCTETTATMGAHSWKGFYSLTRTRMHSLLTLQMSLTNCSVSICRLCYVQRVTCCRSRTLFFAHIQFLFLGKSTKRVHVWVASWNANFFIPSLCLMNGQQMNGINLKRIAA